VLPLCCLATDGARAENKQLRTLRYEPYTHTRLKSSWTGGSAPLTTVRVWVTVVWKEPFLWWLSNYEGRSKSSWTGGSAQLLWLTMHNSGVLPQVHELFKRPSRARMYVCMYVCKYCINPVPFYRTYTSGSAVIRQGLSSLSINHGR
jgi:hypothetical protein